MKRASVRFAAVTLFLILLLGATYAVEAWQVSQIEARGDAAQAEAVTQATQTVEWRIRQIEARIVQQAEDLAGWPLVHRALEGDSTARAEVVRAFSELQLPPRTTAELYTPTPELVAWHGASLPLDAATRTTRFLAAPQTAIAADGMLRQALVTWLPVRQGRRVLGAVRVFELVETRVPVRNQYLNDFDIVEQWQIETGLPLDVRFGPAADASADSSAHEIRSADGVTLAQVSVSAPSLEALKDAVRKTAGDVIAFWVTLLLGWGVAGLWMLHVHARRRAVHAQEGREGWSRAVGSFIGLVVAWGGLRYALLSFDVPGRWVEHLGGLGGEVPLFDPVYLASGIGGGLIGSAGELIVTAMFAVVFGVLCFWFAFGVLRHMRSVERGQTADRVVTQPGAWWVLRAMLSATAGTGMLSAVAFIIRRATLDATLPYFDRTEPLPQGLVMLVFGAFLLLALAAVLVLAGLGVLVRVKGRARFVAGAGVVALTLIFAYAVTPIGQSLPWLVAVAFFAVGGGLAGWMEQGPDAWAEPLMLRRVLLALLVVTALAYPITYNAAQDKREARIADAAEEFADGEDARVAFALEGVLLDARASDAVAEALRGRFGQAASPEQAAPFDSLATDLVTGSLLAALADYTIGLSLLGPGGDTLGYYREVALPDENAGSFEPAVRAGEDPLSFGSLRRRYAADTAPGFVVEREAAPEGRGKYRYAGVGPIRRASDGAILGWVTAQAEPKPARYVSETPFPRVLVPAGLSNVVESDLAFAEFRDGVLVRARGSDYGRFRLPESVTAMLRKQPEVWRTERFGREQARVYYRRVEEDGRWSVISVRAPAVIVYDHLYFYLRMLLPALVLGFVAYPLGVWVRRRVGLLLHRRRLRDRVLNRFLLVGVASVVLTGLIGQRVVVVQNRQAVQDRLKLRLARVESALYDEATPEGGSLPLYRLIDRARPDIVGPRLGLDVNLYRGADLVASSRSQLVRQQLLDRRLDSDVYETLFVEGERYAFAEERIGTFTYTTGYEALPDESGRPGAVIAVPTLPEQTAIEADQARMIAYLFGVLLVLLVGIFLITTLLANRLTRPFRRLREGLLAVGAGQDSEPIPVESSDEVGELIETFNAMQHQLDESRRKLAQQERELAWREMARQVAHEIKNPLTPMKLSVQHLRRAHRAGGSEAGGDGEAGRFAALLDRITSTLIEQIDALTRIANEFSSFARLPSRHLERLDLNAVIREAAALIGEEEHARLVLALADESLPIVADREELRRVYINLFKNALQAMPEDERGTISVRTERRAVRSDTADGWAVSTVRDTGTGIPDEVRDKVFQPNFSTKTSGMGLGLAITKKAVEDVGGEIGFETEIGVGTTFHVRLPLAPADLTEPTEAAGDGLPE